MNLTEACGRVSDDFEQKVLIENSTCGTCVVFDFAGCVSVIALSA